ncbi:hypothetical protein V8E54_013871 [Elaphomyces granulatus]
MMAAVLHHLVPGTGLRLVLHRPHHLVIYLAGNMGRRMNNAVSSHFTTLMAPDGKTRLYVDTATGRPPKTLTAWPNILRNVLCTRVALLARGGPTQLKLNLKQQPLRVRSISREEQAKFEKKADYAIYFKKTATRLSKLEICGCKIGRNLF